MLAKTYCVAKNMRDKEPVHEIFVAIGSHLVT